MKIIDSKGRIFGLINIFDLGATLVILGVIIGIFFIPGTTGGSVAQIGESTKVEVDLLVRGLTVKDPTTLYQEMKENKKTSIIIRNQPYSQVKIKDVMQLPRTTVAPQPDGSILAKDDPRPEVTFIQDMLITLEGDAQITDGGAVFAQQKVKIGTVLELDGTTYNFKGSVIDVRFDKTKVTETENTETENTETENTETEKEN
jgi:hypothetical protein